MGIRTKRIIALSICLLLLTAAIVQNVRNNKNDKKAGKDNNKDGIIVNDGKDNDNETGDILNAEEFFAGARLERDSIRSLNEAECIAVIGDQEATEVDKAQAHEMQLALEMMAELVDEMEVAIKTRGYEDVFIDLDENGYINVTVMSEDLTEQEVMVLADIVVDATNASLDQLTVKSII